MTAEASGMRTTAVIIGAGQAGLAMSRNLTDRAVDHVVLERGAVANAWRTERWDSLRLLTPNWMTRLPSWRYTGDDPDGYMSAADVATFLTDYQRSFDAPVITGTTVTSVRRTRGWYTIATTNGTWACRAVVVATGAAGTPGVPAIAREIPATTQQVTPTRYRNPDDVADGHVLVVGASASGVQIAEDLAKAGRHVTISVGDHVRVPRTYRGMDIHWWMDAIGQLDERIEDVEDPRRARRLPSLQLIGSPEKRALDLNALADIGVDLVGRVAGVRSGRAQFSGSLANFARSADLKQDRLLDRIDAFASSTGLADEIDPPDRPAPTRIGRPRNSLELRSVSAIVWATGFRPDYPWLDPRLLDQRGAIVHDCGVMTSPGMYVLGLPFMRRRKSSFIDGVGPDSTELTEHLVAHLSTRAVRSGIALR